MIAAVHGAGWQLPGAHPAFGHLSYDEYGALMAKHTDHHLRQFGL